MIRGWVSPRKSLSSLIRWTGISGDHTSKHMALVSNSVKILSLTLARQDMQQPQQSMPITVSSLWRRKTCVPAVYKLEPALARLPCLWGADTGINYSLRHIQLSLLLFFFLESVEVLSKQEPRNKPQYIRWESESRDLGANKTNDMNVGVFSISGVPIAFWHTSVLILSADSDLCWPERCFQNSLPSHVCRAIAQYQLSAALGPCALCVPGAFCWPWTVTANIEAVLAQCLFLINLNPVVPSPSLHPPLFFLPDTYIFGSL